MRDTNDSLTVILYSSQVHQLARVEVVLGSRHLPHDLGQPVSGTDVPTVRDEEANAHSVSAGHTQYGA